MILADSCVWIEWFADGPNASAYEADLEGPVLVPPIVLAEVTRWFLRERGADELRRVQAQLVAKQVHPMTAAIGNLAGELGVRHGLAMADAIVYAHAVASGTSLVTQDAHFRGLAGVDLRPGLRAT
jgi:predicted nucleic acid-binding protein